MIQKKFKQTEIKTNFILKQGEKCSRSYNGRNWNFPSDIHVSENMLKETQFVILSVTVSVHVSIDTAIRK